MKKIKIRLSKSHDQEFDVTLIISNEPEDLRGFLPLQPPDLQSSFNQWLSGYRSLEGVRLELKNIIVSSDVQSQTREVIGLLNEWLNFGSSQWLPIRDKLIEVGSRWQGAKKEEMYILLDFPEEKFIQLGRIPWQEWDLFKNYYSDSEIALRLYGKQAQTILTIKPYRKVRILLVVGRSDNIQTENDIKIVKKLKKKGAEVTVLLQPTKEELSEALWEEPGYHIFIFSGHSSCDQQTPINWLELNQQDRISIKDFEIAFGKAIAKGLQLAIFNSCHGLGLAQQLAKLNVPRSIVMRELVPDQVAVEFLEHFFEEFTKNKSLFTSVHIARKRLEHFNDRFPNATWLPTLCIRESALHTRFTWNKLGNSMIKLPPRIWKLLAAFIITVLAGLLIWGVVIVSFRLIPPSCPEKEISFLELRQQIWKRLFPKKCLAYRSHLPTQKEWRYGGSTTWAKIRREVDKTIQRMQPNFKLKYEENETEPPGSDTGIKMLLNGQLDFAQSSRNITDKEIYQARKNGFIIRAIPVAINGIAIAVHPNLDVPGLTISQLKAIYTGKITNWSEVGGPNLSITPYSRKKEAGGTVNYFVGTILDGEEFGKNIQFTYNTTEAIRKVAKDPGGIYYGSAADLVPQCTIKPLPLRRTNNDRFIAPYQKPFIHPNKCHYQNRNQVNSVAFKKGTYPITRDLFVIVKENGKAEEKAGEAYIDLLRTDEGKKLLEKAGFIPID